jgi:hypothetical protein
MSFGLLEEGKNYLLQITQAFWFFLGRNQFVEK